MKNASTVTTLQTGDLLYKLSGKLVRSITDLEKIMWTRPKVNLEIFRKGSIQKVQLTPRYCLSDSGSRLVVFHGFVVVPIPEHVPKCSTKTYTSECHKLEYVQKVCSRLRVLIQFLNRLKIALDSMETTTMDSGWCARYQGVRLICPRIQLVIYSYPWWKIHMWIPLGSYMPWKKETHPELRAGWCWEIWTAGRKCSFLKRIPNTGRALSWWWTPKEDPSKNAGTARLANLCKNDFYR